MNPTEIAGIIAQASSQVTMITGDATKDERDRTKVANLLAELEEINNDYARDIESISESSRKRFDSKLRDLNSEIERINTGR